MQFCLSNRRQCFQCCTYFKFTHLCHQLCRQRTGQPPCTHCLGPPLTHTRLGDRAFAAAGPRLWNDLPAQIRRPDLSLDTFRQKLKTYLFVRGTSAICTRLGAVYKLTYLLTYLRLIQCHVLLVFLQCTDMHISQYHVCFDVEFDMTRSAVCVQYYIKQSLTLN